MKSLSDIKYKKVLMDFREKSFYTSIFESQTNLKKLRQTYFKHDMLDA